MCNLFRSQEVEKEVLLELGVYQFLVKGFPEDHEVEELVVRKGDISNQKGTYKRGKSAEEVNAELEANRQKSIRKGQEERDRNKKENDAFYDATMQDFCTLRMSIANMQGRAAGMADLRAEVKRQEELNNQLVLANKELEELRKLYKL